MQDQAQDQTQEKALIIEPYEVYFTDINPEITSLISEGRGPFYINNAFSEKSGNGIKNAYIKCEEIILYITSMNVFPQVKSIKFNCKKFVIFGGSEYNKYEKTENSIEKVNSVLSVKFPNAVLEWV